MGIPQFSNQFDTNGLPIVPKESDLWKKEKSFYRNWIIFSIVVIVLFLSLLIVFIAMGYVWKDSSIADFSSKINGSSTSNPSDIPAIISAYGSYYNGMFAIFPIIVLVFLSLMLVIYIMSIFKSYKSKSFRFLMTQQNWILVIFGLFGFIYTVSNRYLSFSTGPSYIFFIILSLISIIIVIYPLRKITKFRQEFNMSFNVQNIKDELLKNPNAFNQGMNNPFGGGMFGNMFGGGMFGGNPYVNQPNPNNPNVNPNTPPNASNAEFKEAPADEPVQAKPVKDQFDDMSTDQLKEIASKLLISGSETMTRSELLKRIRELMDQQKQDEFGQKK